METTVLEDIVSEMRDEFQIPPYYDDAQLKNLAKEGYFALDKLNSGQDIKNDLQFRMLVKNYMYYGVHHRVNEFFDNYGQTILGWQANTEVL